MYVTYMKSHKILSTIAYFFFLRLTSVFLHLTGHVKDGVTKFIDATPTFTADEHGPHDVGKPLHLLVLRAVQVGCRQSGDIELHEQI